MRQITLRDSTKIKLYDSIEEFPQSLNNEFHAYRTLHSELGRSMEDFDNKWTKVYTLIAHDKKEDALQEMRNVRHTYYHGLNGIDHNSLAFGCYIYSVDAVKLKDRSEESIGAMLKELSKRGLTAGMVEKEINEIKKNFKLS